MILRESSAAVHPPLFYLILLVSVREGDSSSAAKHQYGWYMSYYTRTKTLLY